MASGRYSASYIAFRNLHPLAISKFSTPHVSIPDWIFMNYASLHPPTGAWKLYEVLRAFRTHLSVGKTHFAHVFCSSNKDMSIHRYNRIATPKHILFPLDRRKNSLCNESLRHYNKTSLLMAPTYYFSIPAFRKSLFHIVFCVTCATDLPLFLLPSSPLLEARRLSPVHLSYFLYFI